MPGQKISSMTLVKELQDIDQFPIARNGSTYKIAGASLASRAQLDSLSASIENIFSSGSLTGNFSGILDELSASTILLPNNPSQGQVLTYDDFTETWVASAAPGGNLPTGNDVLPYDILTYNDETKTWVASAAPLGGGGSIEIKGDGAPIGSVMYFAASSAPAGWLECNGQLVSRAIYLDLYRIIKYTFGRNEDGTQFALPDLRGEFVRGWDHYRGVDLDRAFGSWQKGSFAGDTSFAILSGQPLTATKMVLGFDGDVGDDYQGLQLAPLSSANYNMIVVDEEEPTNSSSLSGVVGVSRPRNVALLPCIKYTHHEQLNIVGLSAQDIIDTVNALSAFSLGTNQLWVELSSTRMCNVTYTNTTLKPICVQVYFSSTRLPLAGECSATLSLSTAYIDTTVKIYGTYGIGGISSNNLTFIVPPFWSYRVNTYGNNFNSWVELR